MEERAQLQADIVGMRASVALSGNVPALEHDNKNLREQVRNRYLSNTPSVGMRRPTRCVHVLCLQLAVAQRLHRGSEEELKRIKSQHRNTELVEAHVRSILCVCVSLVLNL